jgi:hypothetical protein
VNFTDEVEACGVHVELKYCERCGGLWLRSRGTAGVHCRACCKRLAAIRDGGGPLPAKTARRRRRKGGAVRGRAKALRIERLQGIAAMEVTA